MRSGREILLFDLLTLCLAALAGCGEKAAEEEPTEELIIEALVGIGPVQFGTPQNQVIEHFGEPDRIFEGKVTKLNYVASRGLSFAFDAELGLQEISCWVGRNASFSHNHLCRQDKRGYRDRSYSGGNCGCLWSAGQNKY